MFDIHTGKTIYVMDLDTIIPGFCVCDFAYSIRFGATTGAWDDRRDVSCDSSRL